ncbi:MAG TPA: PPK2 family polyphosphate kinase [Pedobacter sp.]|uniref:PPK2 family polyphosphate kinase n=1 Tax=Pedobacter sp. TaxID=1411316 RepID=UPI002C8AD5B7|nr:PPK2 family polyphosphate kinase [Pedobacter sp.]HMI05145.1 PPK2 family polyphosphate kinase [Pedobacter sp.]
MKKEIAPYVAPPKKKIRLNDYSTTYSGPLDKETGQLELEKLKKSLHTSQEKLYASGTHAVLVIIQAMDAAGKDSAIEHVFSGINPQGCQVHNFKTPTSAEYGHDFLWRHYTALPARGKIGIHNRSHYEYVLVCKVHPEYILNENLPGYTLPDQIDQRFWKNRYESIRNFETHLSANGTAVIKIFLHVSRSEQKQRFLDRINDPEKNWKFAGGDLRERELWDQYQVAYAEAISATTTQTCPWYIVPADKKWYARLIIAKILAETFEKLDLRFPVLGKDEQSALAAYKKELEGENESS